MYENKDRGGFLWGLLGYIVPLVGLILFLVWRDERPRTAKAVGTGALVSVILGILLYIVMFILLGMSAALISL